MSNEPFHWFVIRFLFLTLFSLASILQLPAQELTIYTIPSPKGYNWNSPRKLVFSYISNFFSAHRKTREKHLIGHMIVELRDSTRHVIVGVSPARHSHMIRKVLVQGKGLGILFEKTKGVLKETQVNSKEIEQRIPSGEIAFLQFRISQPVFERLWQYYSEYKENGYYQAYNGLNNPLERTGSGCSAFAFSFLEVAGLQDMIPPEICRIERPVPFSLMRNEASHWRPVSVVELLFANKWPARNDFNSQLYTTFEPTWLFQWIQLNQPYLPATGKIQQTWLMNAPGVLFDCREKPVPVGSFWKN
jgi:hypothetical protein